MIIWFNSWNGCIHCSMCKYSRIIANLLKHIDMRHWRACHDFLCLCQLKLMFHLLMKWDKSSWNITLPFSFLPWIVVLYFGKMLVKSYRTLETNGKTFLMPKFFIVFPMMFLYFPYQYNDKNWNEFSSYWT
jgi:hypothetical protein